MNRETAKKIAALAVSVLLIAGTLVSLAFLCAYESHEHDHSGVDGSCAACACLALSGNLLKLLAAALDGAGAPGFGGLSAVLPAVMSAAFRTDSFTLVSLKTRLNN